MASAFGALLDPAADKIMIACLGGALAYCSLIPWWFMAVTVGRDAALFAVGLHFRAETKKAEDKFFAYPTTTVTPTLVSRVNTALQFAALGTARRQRPAEHSHSG